MSDRDDERVIVVQQLDHRVRKAGEEEAASDALPHAIEPWPGFRLLPDGDDRAVELREEVVTLAMSSESCSLSTTCWSMRGRERISQSWWTNTLSIRRGAEQVASWRAGRQAWSGLSRPGFPRNRSRTPPLATSTRAPRPPAPDSLPISVEHQPVSAHPPRSRRDLILGLGALSLAGLTKTAMGSARGRVASPAPGTTGPAGSSEYLLAPGLIHLNTASLGATPRAVLDSMLQAWGRLESDPVRMAYFRTGETVLSAAEKVRERAAALLGCDSDEVLLTRCTTDGMNNLAQAVRWSAGDRILTTDQEHHGGSLGWAYQSERRGVVLDRVAIAPDDHDHGAIVRRFADAITPTTRVISVSHVITSTGLRMPVFELSALARERGILCVVDGAQALGGFPVDVKALGCHAYAASGHKWLMGPKGTGLLYVARDAWPALMPVQWQDEHHFGADSAGVGPLPLVIGLGTAIERLQATGLPNVERHGMALRDRAFAGLKKIARLRVVGPPPGPSATAMIACMLPDEVESKAVRDTLRSKYNIAVKMVEKHWFNGIRLSPHVLNTESDVDAVLRALRSELG